MSEKHQAFVAHVIVELPPDADPLDDEEVTPALTEAGEVMAAAVGGRLRAIAAEQIEADVVRVNLDELNEQDWEALRDFKPDDAEIHSWLSGNGGGGFVAGPEGIERREGGEDT
jgi:hypothetical protein